MNKEPLKISNVQIHSKDSKTILFGIIFKSDILYSHRKNSIRSYWCILNAYLYIVAFLHVKVIYYSYLSFTIEKYIFS